MKKGVRNILIIACVVILLIIIFSVQNSNVSDEYVISKNDFVNPHNLIDNVSLNELSQNEIDGLVLMREEEKLARDVYLRLGEMWNMKIFNNIANSEQTHTDSVEFLLDKYEIVDPVKDNSIGVFESTELLTLYNNLIERGSQSLLDALVVGALVEDLDINDLENLLQETNNNDIKIVYDNLQRGSRNHLRAYVSQIQKNKGSYSPIYISQEEFNLIISSQQETGN